MADDKSYVFGKSYNNVGDNDANLCLCTSGDVKIKTKHRYVTIFKDGKLNVDDSSEIFSVSSVDDMDKTGIYLVTESDDDGESQSVYLNVDGTSILLATSGEGYVSYAAVQELTADNFVQALSNIGLYFQTLEAAQSAGIVSGLVYVTGTGTLYKVVNGEFIAIDGSSSTETTVTTETEEEEETTLDSLQIGAILIDGVNNTINGGSSLTIAISSSKYVTFGNNKITVWKDIVFGADISVSSKDAVEGESGFMFYTKDGETYLEVDNLIVHNGSSSEYSPDLYEAYVGTKTKNLITGAEFGEASMEVRLSLKYENTFAVGDWVLVHAAYVGNALTLDTDPYDADDGTKVTRIYATLSELPTSETVVKITYTYASGDSDDEDALTGTVTLTLPTDSSKYNVEEDNDDEDSDDSEDDDDSEDEEGWRLYVDIEDAIDLEITSVEVVSGDTQVYWSENGYTTSLLTPYRGLVSSLDPFTVLLPVMYYTAERNKLASLKNTVIHKLCNIESEECIIYQSEGNLSVVGYTADSGASYSYTHTLLGDLGTLNSTYYGVSDELLEGFGIFSDRLIAVSPLWYGGTFYGNEGNEYPTYDSSLVYPEEDPANEVYDAALPSVAWVKALINALMTIATASELGHVKLGSDTVQVTVANDVTDTPSRTYAVQLNESSQMVVNVPWETGMTIDEADARFLRLTGGTETGMVTFDGGVYVTGTAGTGGGIRFETSNSGELTIDYNGIRTETGLNIDFTTGGTIMYLNNDNGDTHVTINGNDGTIVIDGKMTAESITLTGGDGTKLLADNGTSITIGSGLSLSGGNLYVPVATSSQLGAVKLGSDTKQTTTVNNVSSTSGRTYAVQLNSNNQMVVNVPWTSGDDSGSTVSFTQTQTSGTQIGTITIDGTSTSIYSPSVSYTQNVTSGTQIGAITINGASTSIFVPTPSFTSTYNSTTGVQIGSFSFNGNTTILYAPSAGSSVADGNYYHTPIYTSGLSIGTGVGVSDMYVPVATSSQFGVVKLGSDTKQGTAANSVTSTSGRTYAVQLNSSNQMVVNVPWTDTVSGDSGGSTVSFTQIQTSGTQIGTITIDGTSTNIYAPSVSYSPTLTSGTEVGKLTINGTTTTLYCSSGGSSTDVNVTNTLSTSSTNVYVTGTSSSSTNTGTQLFSSGVYFIPSSGYVYANAYYETSDANLKEGISDVSDEDMSREISIREFSFRSDESKTRKYGVIAQELEEAGLGNLVSTDGDGVKSVDYISMLCLKIRQLEERIRELENKEQ